jgi:2Fe-2S ferredoxin
MEILRDAGLPIAADCGGACACATCHIYVDQDWYAKLTPPGDSEVDMAVAVNPSTKFRNRT